MLSHSILRAQDALDQHTELLLPLDRRLDDHHQVVVACVVLECLLLMILGLMIPALGLQQNLTSAYCTGLISKVCPVQKQVSLPIVFLALSLALDSTDCNKICKKTFCSKFFFKWITFILINL